MGANESVNRAYEASAVQAIRTWFLDPETAMNPNLQCVSNAILRHEQVPSMLRRPIIFVNFVVTMIASVLYFSMLMSVVSFAKVRVDYPAFNERYGGWHNICIVSVEHTARRFGNTPQSIVIEPNLQ